MRRRYFIASREEHHNLASFTCGNPTIDDVLHDPDHLANYGKTYVVVSHPGDDQILACFTLLPDLQEVFFPSGGYIAVLLNILAVDTRYQRKGIGKWILSQLISDIVDLATDEIAPYLLIEPIDDEASAYYQHLDLGFVRLSDGKLVLAHETMRNAVGRSRRRR
jgi:GNAT superfamily N-acetyltransferase